MQAGGKASVQRVGEETGRETTGAGRGESWEDK